MVHHIWHMKCVRMWKHWNWLLKGKVVIDAKPLNDAWRFTDHRNENKRFSLINDSQQYTETESIKCNEALKSIILTFKLNMKNLNMKQPDVKLRRILKEKRSRVDFMLTLNKAFNWSPIQIILETFTEHLNIYRFVALWNININILQMQIQI